MFNVNNILLINDTRTSEVCLGIYNGIKIMLIQKDNTWFALFTLEAKPPSTVVIAPLL